MKYLHPRCCRIPRGIGNITFKYIGPVRSYIDRNETYEGKICSMYNKFPEVICSFLGVTLPEKDVELSKKISRRWTADYMRKQYGYPAWLYNISYSDKIRDIRSRSLYFYISLDDDVPHRISCLESVPEYIAELEHHNNEVPEIMTLSYLNGNKPSPVLAKEWFELCQKYGYVSDLFDYDDYISNFKSQIRVKGNQWERFYFECVNVRYPTDRPTLPIAVLYYYKNIGLTFPAAYVLGHLMLRLPYDRSILVPVTRCTLPIANYVPNYSGYCDVYDVFEQYYRFTRWLSAPEKYSTNKNSKCIGDIPTYRVDPQGLSYPDEYVAYWSIQDAMFYIPTTRLFPKNVIKKLNEIETTFELWIYYRKLFKRRDA